MRRARHRCAAALLAASLVATSGRAVAAPTDAAAPTPNDPASAPLDPDNTAGEDAAPPADAESDATPEDDAAATPDDTPPQPEPASAAPQPEPEAEPVQGTRVRLLGGQPGELELFRVDPEAGDDAVGTLGGIPYTRVCSDPCSQRVPLDANDELFVAGPRIMPSKTFTLEEEPYELELRVRSGPKNIRFAGFGLTVAGAILIPGGGLLVGAVEGRGPDIAGFTLIGVGVAALAAGIGLLIRGRTVVQTRARR